MTSDNASFTRREFVRASSALAAAPWLAGAAASLVSHSPAGAASPRRAGPNGKIGLGFIGAGKRAFELLPAFLAADSTRVLAVCDVDTTRRQHAKGIVDKHYADSGCAEHIDYRELLAHEGIDAVVICTPDHWHANQVIDAAVARKDIYCEKPLTLTLLEGKLMIDAVRRAGVVFQTGSQQRTEFGHKFVTACEYVRAGRIGRVISVNVGVGVSSRPCDLPEEPLEPGLDWDRWLGPAPQRGYNSVLSPRGVHSHYPNWRLYREYSGGMMTDFGAHNFDIAQWGLGMDHTNPVEAHPPRDPAAMHGARLVYDNGVEMHHGGPGGITFVGTEGVIHVYRDRLASIPESILKQPLGESDARLPRHASHHDNWLRCIAVRETPICDVEVGARSIACAHLCNLAYWNRRSLKWDPQKWEFVGDDQANAWRDYSRRLGYALPRM